MTPSYYHCVWLLFVLASLASAGGNKGEPPLPEDDYLDWREMYTYTPSCEEKGPILDKIFGDFQKMVFAGSSLCAGLANADARARARI